MAISRILKATTILLLIWLLASCQVGPSPIVTSAPQPTERVQATSAPLLTPTSLPLQGTVSIWHSWDEARLPVLLQAIADFQDQYPDVLFDVLYVPPIDLKASYEVASSEGRAPDILLGPGDWGPELYDRGWVADLSGLAAPEMVDSLNPAGVEAGRSRGALVGLPVSLEGVVLYHNQQLIPISPPTFDDLVSMAKQATKDNVFGAYLERSFFYSGAHLNGIGGQLMDENGSPAFNDQHGIEWIELLRRFELAGPAEFVGGQDVEYFNDNRAGFIVESTRLRDSLREAIGSANLVIDPWPATDDGALSGYVQAENVYVNPRVIESDRQAPWVFAQSLLSPSVQSYLAEAGSIPAATPETFTLNRILVDDDLIEQAMVALEGGTPYPVRQEMPIYLTAMDTALASVFNAGTSPQEALQSAEDSVIAAISAQPTVAPAVP